MKSAKKVSFSLLSWKVEKGFQDLFSPLISSGEMSTNFFGGCHLSSLRGNAVLRKRSKGMSREAKIANVLTLQNVRFHSYEYYLINSVTNELLTG